MISHAILGQSKSSSVIQNINGILISKSLIESIELETGKVFKPFYTYQWKDSLVDTTNYGHWDSISSGIFIHSIKESIAYNLFEDYFLPIQKESNYLFLTNLHFDTLKNKFYDVAILKTVNQLEVVKQIGTSGINYDVSNKTIIEQLKKWDKSIGLQLQVIDKNRIQGFLPIKPKKIKQFAKEVSIFCPQILEGHYKDLKSLTNHYLSDEYFEIWWD